MYFYQSPPEIKPDNRDIYLIKHTSHIKCIYFSQQITVLMENPDQVHYVWWSLWSWRPLQNIATDMFLRWGKLFYFDAGMITLFIARMAAEPLLTSVVQFSLELLHCIC